MKLHSYRTLKAELTVSESTIRRWIAAGKFPRPHYLGGRVVFYEGEVQQAVAKLVSQFPPPPRMRTPRGHPAGAALPEAALQEVFRGMLAAPAPAPHRPPPPGRRPERDEPPTSAA